MSKNNKLTLIVFLNRYRREKVRSDAKDKNDKYTHSDYRGDDNRKNYDHRRDFKRNVSIFNILLYLILFYISNIIYYRMRAVM